MRGVRRRLPGMGMKTWKVGAKAAGTHVGGRVIVENPGRELNATARALGQEVVDAVNRTAKQWRPVDDRQPVTGERAEELVSYTVMAGVPLMMLRDARTANRAARAAGMLAEICRDAMSLEPRFAAIYSLAVTAREQAEQGVMEFMPVLCTSISWALPQPVRLGAVAHAMRVEISEVTLPKLGGPKRAGLAGMRMDFDCEEVRGVEIVPEPSTIYFPLPLFGPNKAEPDVVLEMWVGDVQVTVDLSTKRSGFGALREIVYAVEKVVQAHRLERARVRPA